MGVSSPDQSQAICAALKRKGVIEKTGHIKIIFGEFVISDLHQSELRNFFPS